MPKKPFKAASLLPKQGLVVHAAKTALAAVLTLYAVRTFTLEQGYWAVITTVIVMQANLGGSMRAGWSRLLGTAVGAAIGALLLLVLGNGALALGVGVFCIMLVCSMIPLLRDSMRIAGITAVIVTLIGRPGENPFHVGAVRFSEIALGILVSLAVSVLILPRRSKTAFRHGLAKMLEEEAAFYEEVFQARATGRFRQKETFYLKDKLARLLIRNSDLLREARAETLDERSMALLTSIFRNLDRLFENLLTMEHVVEDAKAESIHAHVNVPMAALKDETIARMRDVAAALTGKGELPDFASLDQAVGEARGRMAALRKAGTPRNYDLAEVMHFFSFIHAMLACAAQVREAAARTAELTAR